jgi:hypothetical protein
MPDWTIYRHSGIHACPLSRYMLHVSGLHDCMTTKMPDCVSLVRYRTCSGTGHVPVLLVFFSPVPNWLDVGWSGIPAFLYIWTWTLTWACSIDMDMLHDQSRAVCTCPCCMSMSILHVHVHVACSCQCCMPMSMSMFIYIYRNAGMLDHPTSSQSGTGLKKTNNTRTGPVPD